MAVKKAAKKVADKQRTSSEGRARSLANLRPFLKGQSGNPAGRPKSITFSEACRKILEETEGETQETVAEALARAAIKEAKAGSAPHLKEINDRVEGKAKQTVEIVGDLRERLAKALGVPLEEMPAPDNVR